MKINKVDGSVSFTDGSIDPAMDKAAFLRSPLGSKSEQWFVNGTFETYRFLPEPGIVATTDFRDGRLLNVSILFSMQDDSENNVSVEHERQRKLKHDAWLRGSLGDPPYRYNWGHVSSDFYHQHCESDIMVVYES
jgi:hypothetical protein